MTTHILTKEQRKAQQSRTFLKVLNSLPLEMALDWLHRATYAYADGEPLTLKRYLTETKEVGEASFRMKEIDNQIEQLSLEDSERRDKQLAEQRFPFFKDLEGMVY